MKIIRGLLVGIAVLSMVFAAGCGFNKNANNSTGKKNKISVYTSFYVMSDFAKKIGGDKIDLTNLVPAGTEPHDWEPTPSAIASLEKADVFIYNGAGMEGWVNKVLQTINNKDLITVEASKGIQLIENTEKAEELAYDPHVWLDPMKAKKQMEMIKDALIKADPSNRANYESNFSENAKKFDDLDKEYKNAVSKFVKKDIVVAHKAFGYLCNAYGLNQVAIEGLSAESEPTPARMAEIAKFAKENGVKYIFFEELVSPKVAQTIANEVGAQAAMLNPLEGLTDNDISAGKEYFLVMRDNLEVLRKALQ